MAVYRILSSLSLVGLCLTGIAAQYENCTGDAGLGVSFAGDGYCDPELNTPACAYDGGDCCLCTCVESTGLCGWSGFNCLDPNAGDEFHDCAESPPTFVQCSSEVKREWVVENTAQATALAEAINCSSGTFEVEWRGNVVIEKTMYVLYGTVLNIAGVGGNAGVDGNSATRPFAVINATLHLSDMHVSNGHALFGGAIAATESSMSFTRTAFIDNHASGYRGYGHGGAIYITEGSTAVWAEETQFTGNNAANSGGVMYVSDGSNVSWSGKAEFSANRADWNGGVLSIFFDSSVSWQGENVFSNNSALIHGGSLLAGQSSSVSWRGVTTFEDNTAGQNGGALCLFESSVSWVGQTTFVRNKAGGLSGGALHVGFSSVSWAGEVSYVDNYSGWSGGALGLEFSSSVTWTGDAAFGNNVAVQHGGAMHVSSSHVSWGGEANFYNSRAGKTGGAIDVKNESVVAWDGGGTFFNNSATYGGAVFLAEGSAMNWTGAADFISNSATLYGGAVGSLPNPDQTPSSIVIDGVTNFINNTCSGNGGAIALMGELYLKLGSTAELGFSQNSAKIAGGAMIISDTTEPPTFIGASFISNSAKLGGAVYSSGSGNEVRFAAVKFNGCTFIGNNAETTGGAVQTSAGYDYIVNSLFMGNTAEVGGALRLAASKVVLENCSFVDNRSNEGGGAAVSNVGYIADIMFCSFNLNVFRCDPRTFLDFNKASVTRCRGGGETVGSTIVWCFVDTALIGEMFNDRPGFTKMNPSRDRMTPMTHCQQLPWNW